MALVGDPILAMRAQAPDLPPTLPPPTASFAVVAATGSTLAAGTYLLVVTQRNAFGETLPTAESSAQVVGANQGIQVTSLLLPGASTIRAYLTQPGGTSGGEIQFVESTASPFTISTPPPATGIPPTRATAYLPDMDGPQVSAGIVFGWLNEGLKKLSRITGGLLDYAGVPTQAGNPLYVMPGEWLKIIDVWYNGYWIQGAKRGDFFRRNAVNAQILTGVTVSVFTDRQVLEVTYQPDRNAGSTATTADMTATDVSVPIANISAFLLPFGFAQIGSEIVGYSSLLAGAMSGLIRGLGSASPAQAWPSGTTVKELPLFWCGKRVFGTTYAPGQSNLNLPVPDGWDPILKTYLLGCFRELEQDERNAERLYKQFASEGEAWMYANRLIPSFVQVGGTNQPEIYAPTIAGGLLVR